MALLEFFRPKKPTTASVAKERLQIIVAERRSSGQGTPSYLPQLKQDILEVIRKYVEISPDQVSVNLDQKEEDLSVLELNVTLPDEDK
ncbi:cell division topological specificity factor MinE [Photobacterium sanctipauli]|uniref:Cell division topological specificity factor n=1 Tax=Photobacterium sanctipauli TaxID=1342794 RepID=A0A2T3NR68_9GAMM|nr:cell division topological specificity factor MinE [Photobacterium sanctipauli]PSW18741.1 cell division topological specificity factor MinE [Photobacterium sanctipauli]